MESAAPAVAAAPASRLDMSLDDCIKLSGGAAAKKRGPPPRSRINKRREKTTRKPAVPADGNPNADSGGGGAAVQNGAGGGGGTASAAATPDAGRAAGGISKKRRRSKKPAGANNTSNSAEDAPSAPVARQPKPASQKNKSQDAGKGNYASQQRNGPVATAKPAIPARSSPTVSTPQAAATSRIAVSNLNDTVSEEDIKELFGDVGPLVSAKLQLDKDGRSAGRAEVVFARMADALEAIKRYNGIPLDEMPLRITLATDRSTVVEPAPSAQPSSRGGRYARGQRGESRRGGHGPSRGISKSQSARPAPRSPTEG